MFEVRRYAQSGCPYSIARDNVPRQQGEDDSIPPPAPDLENRAQSALTLEARLFGNSERGNVARLDPHLHPTGAELLECPAREQAEGPRGYALPARFPFGRDLRL